MFKQTITLLAVFSLAIIIFGCSKSNDVVAPSQDEVLPAFEVASLSSGIPDEVAGDLGLTPEQREKIRTLMQKFHQDVQALRESYKNGGSREELRAQFAALRAALEEEIKTILTQEQFEQWQKMKGRFGHMGGPKALFDRLRHLARALQLSDEQVEQARAIFDQARQDIKAAFASATDRSVVRETIKEILKIADEQFRSILTTDQLAKYDELIKNRKKPNG